MIAISVTQSVLMFLTAFVLYLSLRRSRELKSIDVVLQSQSRYHNVTSKQKEQADKGEIEPIAYYESYWDLQFAQYQYWRQGFIPDEIYNSWLRFRQRDYAKNVNLRQMSYSDGWEKVSVGLSNTEFTGFMKVVFQDGPKPAMDKYGKARFRIW